jgi:hypothetical protein
MDKFEELINQLNEMSADSKDEKMKEFDGECVCPLCPTYNQCAKESGENIFCIRGKSKECITKERGCNCPTCPLAAKYRIGVIYNFYCMRGGEMDQRRI